MNEQLKELVKQAGLNIDGYGDPIWGCLDGNDAKTQFLKKFTELVVESCVDDLLIQSRYHQVNGNNDVVTALCETAEILREIYEAE